MPSAESSAIFWLRAVIRSQSCFESLSLTFQGAAMSAALDREASYRSVAKTLAARQMLYPHRKLRSAPLNVD